HNQHPSTKSRDPLHCLWLISRCAIHTLWIRSAALLFSANQSGDDNRGAEYSVAGAIVWKRCLQRPGPSSMKEREIVTALPTLYVSHGAPLLALEPGQTGPALAAVGQQLPRPEAILMVSAHWE